jgi:hypothetical protein
MLSRQQQPKHNLTYAGWLACMHGDLHASRQNNARHCTLHTYLPQSVIQAREGQSGPSTRTTRVRLWLHLPTLVLVHSESGPHSPTWHWPGGLLAPVSTQDTHVDPDQQPWQRRQMEALLVWSLLVTFQNNRELQLP